MSASPASAKEILLATDLTRAINHKGLPIAECVFENSEHSPRIVSVPWSRAQLGTKDGTFDGFFTAARSAKREEFAILSEPLLNIAWLYVIRSDSGLNPNDADFFHSSFGANIGTARHAWLLEQHQDGVFSREIVTTSNSENSLKMLIASRIDVNLENNINLEVQFERSGLDAADFKTFLVKQVPAGIYVGKDFLSRNPGFVSEINAKLERCRGL